MTAIQPTPSRPNIFRSSPGARPTILAALALATLTAHAAPARQPDAPATQAEPETAPAAAERAFDELAAGDTRAEAEIIRLLHAPETADAMLAQLAKLERFPPGLWRAISTTTTDRYPLPTRVAAVRLLPRFGSREAATRLLALLVDPEPGVHQPARLALEELTGLGEGWTLEEWTDWGEGAATWSDRAWSSAILARQAARTRTLADHHRHLADEVIALYRRLHVELDAAGRTVLLAELIGDDRPPVRDLGFELAGRDLSARTQLGPEVASAAADRLGHPDPATRARAATLVSRLVPPDAMLTLTRALQTEPSPQAAEPMLLGVARWPNEDAVAPTVRWLDRDDAPFGAVTTALWALAQSDLLNAPETRERVVAALRQRDPVRGGEAALKLLVRLGTPADLALVAAMLTSPEDPVRNAAASALAESPLGTDVLVEAASADPRLFAPAARALTTHHASPDGLRRLTSLPAIDPAERDAAIAALAARLSPEQLAQGVSLAGLTPAMRETVLAPLADPERQRTPGVIDALLLLAEARIESGRPADATALLATIDPAALNETRARQHARLRLIAAVVAGDLDGAATLTPQSLDDWMAAWRIIPPAEPLRPRVARAILERFPRDVTPEVRGELGQAEAREPTQPAPTLDEQRPGPDDAETQAGVNASGS